VSRFSTDTRPPKENPRTVDCVASELLRVQERARVIPSPCLCVSPLALLYDTYVVHVNERLQVPGQEEELIVVQLSFERANPNAVLGRS
jgi:hypothetical protein